MSTPRELSTEHVQPAASLLGEHDRALRAEVVVEDELAVFIPGTRTAGHDQDHNRDRLV